MAATSAAFALGEVALYAYVGKLVDRMSALGVARFWGEEGARLWWMAALVLLVLPLLVLLNSTVQHQASWMVPGNIHGMCTAICCASRWAISRTNLPAGLPPN